MRGDRVNKEEKVERSIPVTSRVDLVSLMRLDKFWHGKGVYMRSLSQIVNWTLEAFIEVLEDNGLIEKDEEKISVQLAYDYLTARRLRQESNMKKGMKKLMNSITMKNLREEGIEPREYFSGAFNTMHNRNSIEAYNGSAGGIEIKGEEKKTVISDEEWEEIQNRIAEEDRKDINEAKKKNIDNARKLGILVE